MVTSDKQKFSLAKRCKSFSHAARGVGLFLKDTHNVWIQLLIFAAVVILGIHYNLSQLEWAVIILASGLVIGAEAFNTAIETEVDLTSPDHHPLARDAKDIAAGAVLIASATAVTVGICVFSAHL